MYLVACNYQSTESGHDNCALISLSWVDGSLISQKLQSWHSIKKLDTTSIFGTEGST